MLGLGKPLRGESKLPLTVEATIVTKALGGASVDDPETSIDGSGGHLSPFNVKVTAGLSRLPKQQAIENKMGH